MRMILMIGIMLLSLPGIPSLFNSDDTLSDATRSITLRAILQNTQTFQDISKRTEATVSVPMRIDCCPAETHLIHPRGGISRDGKLLEIYRDHRTVQKFYQTSCRPEVHDRPCPLVADRVQHLSRCVQKYSFVYAFVRDFNVSESFRLDYIRLKSGCSCELDFNYSEKIEFR